MKEIILTIGTNLGDRQENLKKALDLLKEKISIESISNEFYNNAMLPENAPKEWDKEFINIAIYAKTKLDPYELLSFVKKIEESMGRIDYEKWSPRIIDIDIIFYDKLKIKERDLVIPHPGIFDREFFQITVKEIVPNYKEKFLL
ncbi:MAG: 2-amino-4-hydroxy-6-hydroxymethyldihydropteridine diphosphokinase [Sphingobacteriia bacterium]|nr:2-amino-4-hydroxy-6-hydroxymethyldihydropteridine diphosphokinase [Sphingobacteriia bacterium]